jgi:hypothetical protein
VGTLIPSSHALKLPPRVFDSLMWERRKMNTMDEDPIRKKTEKE